MEYILGLDIGSNSIGWAALKQSGFDESPILGAGVRIFEEGVNIDAKSAKSESRSVKRREARLRRRQLQRHALRKRQVLKYLQHAKLLPPGPSNHETAAWRELLNTDPYRLRAEALDRPLAEMELGRVFFHLAERRGFQSNRKRAPDEKEVGKVKDGIKRVREEWDKRGERTIGEFFSRWNPHERRIRANYTLRSWFKDEFDRVCQAQAPHHAALLTDEWRKKLELLIFDQRPLRSQSHLLGHCELEQSKRRAPMALLPCQEFRLLQDVNHLAIDDGSRDGQKLSPEQRTDILRLLETEEKVKFSDLRRMPSLKRCKFNLERGGRKHLSGNSTAARIRAVLGERWDAMPAADRSRFVNDLMSLSENSLFRRLQTHWKLDELSAQRMAEDVILEQDHSALSSAAIARLLPHLRAGLSYTEAVNKEAWSAGVGHAQNELPALENLRNPIVQRALAETRRVVNAVIRKYGKPARIQVELARDLKMGNDDRAEYILGMRNREKQRDEARVELVNNGIHNPSARDIEKWLLFEECKHCCPYSGKRITVDALFRTNEFDVEHIIPISRSMDNSFANKTLCHVHNNRVLKRNDTPFEAFGDTDAWPGILKRVKEFQGTYAKEKLRRFQLESVDQQPEFLDQFTARQLNDTRYAARRAVEYLQQLYPKEERLSRVLATNGRATAHLRTAWQLNRILHDGPGKSRDDHRHHAVDAICVALTSRATIRELSNAAKSWAEQSVRGGVFRQVPAPWVSFEQDVRTAIDRIVVSRRVSRRVSGPLHEETHYGLITEPHGDKKSAALLAVVRKRLADLNASSILDIVDPAVREAVRTAAGEREPKIVFKEGAPYPLLKTKAGASIPIKKVRIRVRVSSPHSFSPSRQVKLGGNHHLEIVESKNSKGQTLWKGKIISLFEAYTRLSKKQPLYWADLKEGEKPVFTLVQGDTICVGKEKFVLTGISKGKYECRGINDARKTTEIRNQKQRIVFSDKLLLARAAQKLSLSPIGEVSIARD